jgi:tetratricopeptide (TPR) repeat protein
MSAVSQQVDGDGNIVAGSGDVHSSTFNSKGGDQNIAQGQHSIGCQINNYGTQPPEPPRIPRLLPSLDACFLHREKELAWLLDALHPGKVVAICGPGGMGKSALAAQAVHQLESAHFPDGIVFHSFYHQASTEMALQTIAGAFHIEAKAGLESAVRQVLSGRKALLILDGAEEADDLPAVLKLRGTCGVLITSRKRADAQGARLDLTPLEERPAAEVFCAYSGTAADDASVQGICKILGGWPVALRIAGRYLSSTGESAAEYLKWLEQEPFKELGSGKHEEENAALLLRRSMAQVSDDARQALSVFGVLAFEPVARKSIASILDENIRCCRLTLNELVTYGLLERNGERWKISHALIHTYARKELPMSKESMERLAAYYIEWCREQSAAGLPGYARLDGERAHCLRLIESCLNSGLWQKVQALSWAIYTYLDRQGHWIDQIAVFEMRLTAVRQAGDRKDEGLCLNNLGRIYNWRREHEKALACCTQSLAIRRETGDRQGEARNLNNIAKIYATQGKHEQAVDYYKQSLSIAREIGDRQGEGWTLNNAGQLYYHQGDYEQSLQHYEQSLPIRREVGDKIGTGQTLNNIAAIYRAQGDAAKALEYHEQALAICQQLGDKAGEAWTRLNIGRTYEDMGNLATAEEHISLAVQLAETIGHPSLEKFREGLKQVRAELRAA